jgi:general secretion pathway protein C
MSTSGFPRFSKSGSPAVERLLALMPTIAITAAIGAAAWLGTEWFWYFAGAQSAPMSESGSPRSRTDMQTAAEALTAARLFGAEKQAPVPTANLSNLNIKLKGVFAGHPDKPAFAIVNIGARDEFALAGKELMPGVKLDSVHATHVIVSRNGILERVNLEERSIASAGGPRPSPVLMAPRPGPQPVMIPGGPQQGGPAGQAPLSLNSLSRQNFGRIGVRNGGVTVEAAPPGSTLAILGLQPGDVIRSVNGEAVTSEADLARVYQQSANAESVQAEVVRGNRTFPVQVPLKR